MNKMMNNIKVISTGRYVPEKIVSNFDLEKIVDTNDEWIYTRTGIKNRRKAENEETSDLAVKAALNACEKVDYDMDQIDVIVVATVTADVKSPSTANIVQAKLGLNHRDIMCFDVNAGCTGFIYALNVASQLINSGKYRSALVIGSEILSKVTDYTDRGTCVLFGDGAGAILLEQTEEQKPAYFYTASKGDLDETLIVRDTIAMEGNKVYQFATGAMRSGLEKLMDETGLTYEEMDIIIPHQANIRIIQSVAKHLHLPMEKFLINIDQYGNTSAASIIIALDEYLERVEKEKQVNQKIVLVAFGAGFTWGSALLTL
jgi:3-oxoacyl-[acyl-carrier-protein] synthase III